ncbi:MAG TPA: PLD nuclease N-terminal domain-containing protein [Microbacterium sp.]|nr:PLD nuclease N-terminal domain-containing protein [Microbacterium sp.]
MATEQWSDLSTRRKTGMLIAASIHLALAATAWTDLARRPAEQVNGPKAVWAVLIAVNFIGPISYFLFGRKRGSTGWRDRS